jgi:DNA modification methylase
VVAGPEPSETPEHRTVVGDPADAGRDQLATQRWFRGWRLRPALSSRGADALADVIPKDIYPRSPIRRLRREDYADQLERAIDTAAAAAVVGMSYNFAVRAAGYASGSRPRSITLGQVLDLLDLDEYEETFVPRSLVPDYLLRTAVLDGEPEPAPDLIELPAEDLAPTLLKGHAGDLLRRLAPRSVQCAVTSSPYWGMRLYDDPRVVQWADGEHCSYGFEQTPEGFIRHTVELLYLLKPALTDDGSVWWNLMDTYNTRTPIRGSSGEKLRAMGDDPEYALGWTEHAACRHSAGHMYLQDGELAMIPARVAQRASRIGYRVKSYITWNKDSTPEPVKSRVTRQAEVILHLSAAATPYFNKSIWRNLEKRLGGWNPPYESGEKVTDVWHVPTANGKNGHGAEFAVSLAGRCISLTSRPGDLVLDPFVGSGTSALAAMELGRRCIGFDTSHTYLATARERVKQLSSRISAQTKLVDVPLKHVNGASTNGRTRANGQSDIETLPIDVARLTRPERRLARS